MLPRAEIFAALVLPVGIGMVLHGTPDVTYAADLSPASAAHVAVSYAEEVQPLLDQYCVECHGDSNAELGLNLATYEGTMAGSDYGTVVEPGNADASLLVDMIASGDMPEDGDPMPAEELEVIKTWIAEGAENN